MADVWANSMACHPRATYHIAGCKKIVLRQILFFFWFLMQFKLWRAAAFVSSPIHLLKVRRAAGTFNNNNGHHWKTFRRLQMTNKRIHRARHSTFWYLLAVTYGCESWKLKSANEDYRIKSFETKAFRQIYESRGRTKGLMIGYWGKLEQNLFATVSREKSFLIMVKCYTK